MISEAKLLNLQAIRDRCKELGINKTVLSVADVSRVTGLSRTTIYKDYGKIISKAGISIGNLADAITK